MQNRRRSASEITPEWEDTGLFRKGTGEFAVELVPQVSRNSRQDIVIKGYLNGSVEISVIFPGRRAKEAVPVERRLRTLLQKANQAAAKRKSAAPNVNLIRLPIRVEGSWRPRFQRTGSGWDDRSYQLLAARWAFVDYDGMTSMGGRPPAV